MLNTEEGHPHEDTVRSTVMRGTPQVPVDLDQASKDIRRRAARRRRRRTGARVGVGVGGAVALVFGLTVLALERSPEPVLTTASPAGESAGSDGLVLSSEPLEETPDAVLERLELTPGVSGTQKVVLQFDRAIPEAEIVAVEGLSEAELSSISYFTQSRLEPFDMCDAVHGWGNPEGRGTVDVVLPAQWFENTSVGLLNPTWDLAAGIDESEFNRLAKIIPCRLAFGGVQLTIHNPASDDIGDVTVTQTDTTVVIAMSTAGS